MNKVFERTENGTTETVSIAEGLKEINHAMMDGKRDVREMSHGGDRTRIAYKDGRTVTLKRTAAPKAKDTRKNLQTHTGIVHAPGAKTRAAGVGYRPKCCHSNAGLARMHYLAPVDSEVTCKKCLNAIAKGE